MRSLPRFTSSPTLAAVVLGACAGAPSFDDRKPLPDPCVIVADDANATSGAAPRPAATLADVTWLAGDWTGEGLGGAVDETWWPAAGGAMLGMFRYARDGKPSFYELMVLAERDGSLELRLKHFGPDLVGWEEKADSVKFPLVRLEGDTAWFDGLTIQRAGDDAMRSWVRIRNRDGSTRDEQFTYRRATR